MINEQHLREGLDIVVHDDDLGSLIRKFARFQDRARDFFGDESEPYRAIREVCEALEDISLDRDGATGFPPHFRP